jgi:hypothetical protein
MPGLLDSAQWWKTNKCPSALKGIMPLSGCSQGRNAELSARARRADTAPRLAAKIKGRFPSNNAEWVQVLEILEWGGVLPETNRDYPSQTLMCGSAAYWRGVDGLDPARLEEHFGEYL